MSAFTLKGHWIGEASTSTRHFEGTVEQAGDTGLRPGEAVVVTFDPGRSKTPGHGQHEHGQYRLSGLPDDRFVLVGFVRKDGVTGGDAEHADKAQLWGGELYRR